MMPPRDADLRLTLPLTLSALPAARHQVRAFLAPRLRLEQLGEILLCLQEAMKNAVRHSASEYGVDVDVRLADHRVEVVVRDHGVGFSAPHPTTCRDTLAPPEPLADSGRGLYLIGQLMDEVEIESAKGATVRMVKHLA